MNLGGAEIVILLVMLVVLLVGLALPLWAMVDAAARPERAWAAANQNKVLWVVLPIATTVVGFGWLVAAIYFAAIRPQVLAAQRS